MKTHLSDVLILKLIKEAGTLEIWTNQEPNAYHAGKVLIGHEGDRDANAIQSGFLKIISTAANCTLFEVTAEGEAFIHSHLLTIQAYSPEWPHRES